MGVIGNDKLLLFSRRVGSEFPAGTTFRVAQNCFLKLFLCTWDMWYMCLFDLLAATLRIFLHCIFSHECSSAFVTIKTVLSSSLHCFLVDRHSSSCTKFPVTYGVCWFGFRGCYICFRSFSFGVAALPLPFSQKSRWCILLLIISLDSFLLAVVSSSRFTSTPASLASLLQYWAVL